MKHFDLTVKGERLRLLLERAVYWPARKMLLLADVHFGKAASFRALGVPVPSGTTADNLNRIQALLADHDVEEICFLGDFLHARAGQAATLDALLRWRSQHAGLRLTLVRGNHDRHAGDPAPELAIDCVNEPYQLLPFLLVHEPLLPSPDGTASSFFMAGHVHPVYRLKTSGDTLRLPCFAWHEHGLLLPSFGAFTGGHDITPQVRHSSRKALFRHVLLCGDSGLYPVSI